MKFTIPGTPVPKARPRVFRRNTITDPKTVRYEHLVKMCARTAGVRLLEGPVFLGITYYLPDNRRRDGDNMEKAIWDGLKGVAYADDSQVKNWQGLILLDPSNPRAVVTVEPMP